ncbi:hypothetical protein [Virgibacillus salexigens]|uniref:hypothetical protein n=1 Tax=Virgibacillus salexigens TaxID=61016 RepID=UPI00190C24BE|nr:hypothetical protein [Virgibacillus salexigens]
MIKSVYGKNTVIEQMVNSETENGWELIDFTKDRFGNLAILTTDDTCTCGKIRYTYHSKSFEAGEDITPYLETELSSGYEYYKSVGGYYGYTTLTRKKL